MTIPRKAISFRITAAQERRLLKLQANMGLDRSAVLNHAITVLEGVEEVKWAFLSCDTTLIEKLSRLLKKLDS